MPRYTLMVPYRNPRSRRGRGQSVAVQEKTSPGAQGGVTGPLCPGVLPSKPQLLRQAQPTPAARAAACVIRLPW